MNSSPSSGRRGRLGSQSDTLTLIRFAVPQCPLSWSAAFAWSAVCIVATAQPRPYLFKLKTVPYFVTNLNNRFIAKCAKNPPIKFLSCRSCLCGEGQIGFSFPVLARLRSGPDSAGLGSPEFLTEGCGFGEVCFADAETTVLFGFCCWSFGAGCLLVLPSRISWI